MGRCKSLGLVKSFFNMHLNHLGANILFFSILDSPKDAPSGAAAVTDGFMATTFFVYWNSGWHFCPHYGQKSEAGKEDKKIHVLKAGGVLHFKYSGQGTVTLRRWLLSKYLKLRGRGPHRYLGRERAFHEARAEVPEPRGQEYSYRVWKQQGSQGGFNRENRRMK